MAIREILLDTNAYAAFKQNKPDAVQIIRYAPLIGISIIVLGELFAGFAAGSRKDANMRELEQFLDSKRVKIFSADVDTAQKYALIYRNLRQKGCPIPTNDMWITATALRYELAIFSYDAHFRHVDGLISGNCLADFVVPV